MEYVKKFWWAGAIALVLLLLISWFAVSNGITNTGNRMEAGLNAQYPNNINYLSDCIVRIRESSSVLKGQTDALDRILTDAVKGRYDNGNSNAPQVDNGKFFSAITEAYPDTAGLSGGFDKVLSVVNGCRTDYRAQQTLLLKKIEDYDAWRTGSFTARTFGGGFPSGNLTAKKGNETLHGQAALDQMRDVVVVAEAKKAYDTGELQPEDPFGPSGTTKK